MRPVPGRRPGRGPGRGRRDGQHDICVHNIVAACAVSDLIGREGDILKQTFWPFLLYSIPVGIVASILVFGVFA